MFIGPNGLRQNLPFALKYEAMSDHWLYSQQLPAGAADWTLEGDEAQHARAKHLEAGEAIHLFDGRGRVAAARVLDCGKRALTVRIEAVEVVGPRLPRVTVAVSPPKGDRLEWMLEKLTELGVAAIWPVQCERSVVAARDDRMERWHRRLVEAGKQAHVAWLPELAGSQRLGQAVARAGEFGSRVVADTGERQGTGDRGQGTADSNRQVVKSRSDTREDADVEAHPQATALGGGARAGFIIDPQAANVCSKGPAQAGTTNAAGPANSARLRSNTPILATKCSTTDRVLVVIGPEGGFSDGEREAMRRGGLASVSLGPTVLRTETAAVVAAGCLLAAGDLAGGVHGVAP
jgi:16S rRNA (uracil1498-N3)-methyltransferase